MSKSQSRFAGLLLPIALVALFLPAQVSAQKANQTVVYAPPNLTLTSDTKVVSACAGGGQVQLNARASSPGGNPIRYRWSSNAGRIDGNGPTVTWDLSGLPPGTYKAFINIDTGSDDGVCEAFASTTVVVKPCPPKVVPTCPNVEIICPTNIVIDKPLTFSARVSGGTPPMPPIYNWSVSAGRIVEGQGTSSITVDTTGLAGQTVKATLSMGGYTMDCSASCAVSIPVPETKPRKFDEFPDISRNDEKARLDNFAVELQNDPGATAYVIIFPGRFGRPGDVQRHRTRVIDYLVNSRGIDARRIVSLVGGTHEELAVQLWVVPQGATPPNP